MRTSLFLRWLTLSTKYSLITVKMRGGIEILTTSAPWQPGDINVRTHVMNCLLKYVMEPGRINIG